MNLSHALRIRRKEVVALVGGGGKTSAMFRLGDELAARGWRVIMTTSTHIGADQATGAPHVIRLLHELPLPAKKRILAQAADRSPVLVVGAINPQTNKAEGLASTVIDMLTAATGVDAVIVEADGARTLPFKAPADHEPVIPDSTTLVVPVVGIDVVGQPLDDVHVHRPGRVAALTGAVEGRPVALEHIAQVLTHMQGGLKGVPERSRVVPLVNKAETPAQQVTARALADLLLRAPRIEAVAIGAMQSDDPVHTVQGRVAAIVLAAGESRRFGRLKQLLPWGDDDTLLGHAVDVALASRAQPVVVVLGCRADACRQAVASRPVQVVLNPNWMEGQSGSLRAGLASLPSNVSAALFHLADQPQVTPAVMDALIERHANTLAPVVFPEYQGRRGNPVLFDRVTFSELERLSGDTGGRPVLMAYDRAGQVQHVTVDEPGVLLDIDVPADIERM